MELLYRLELELVVGGYVAPELRSLIGPERQLTRRSRLLAVQNYRTCAGLQINLK